MTIAAANLTEVFASQLVPDLRKEHLWNIVTDQSDAYTGPWASGQAEEVRIPVPVWGYTQGSSRGTATDPGDSVGISAGTGTTRRTTWDRLASATSAGVTFDSRGYHTVNQFIDANDAGEVAFPILEATRSRMAYEHADYVDQQVLRQLYSFGGTAVALGAAGTRYISAAGAPTGSGMTAIIRTGILDHFASLAFERNLRNTSAGALGELFCILHPRLWKVLEDDLLNENWSYDPLTGDVLRNNAALTGTPFVGRYKNIDILVSNNADLATTTANDNWRVICGAKAAAVANVGRPVMQMFTPEQNQVTNDIGYLLRSKIEWGVENLTGQTGYSASGFQLYTIEED